MMVPPIPYADVMSALTYLRPRLVQFCKASAINISACARRRSFLTD